MADAAPMLTVTRPVRDGDGYALGIHFYVGGYPVHVALRPRGAFVERVRRLVEPVLRRVRFGGNPYAGLWPHVDHAAQAVLSVCRDPRVLRALASLPFSTRVANAIGDAVHAYCTIRAGGGRELLQRMEEDAAGGSAEAVEALDRLQMVEMADRLYAAAHGGSAQAAQRFGAIRDGLGQGDPHAWEAYATLDALHRIRSGTPAELAPAPLRVNIGWTGCESPLELTTAFGREIMRAAGAHVGPTPEGDALLRVHLQGTLQKLSVLQPQAGAVFTSPGSLGGAHPPFEPPGMPPHQHGEGWDPGMSAGDVARVREVMASGTDAERLQLATEMASKKFELAAGALLSHVSVKKA